jgi:hypothetical protein
VILLVRVLQVALSHFAGQAHELKVVGVFRDLLSEFGILRNKLVLGTEESVPKTCAMGAMDDTRKVFSDPMADIT